MEQFTLDIEHLYQDYLQESKTLKGIFCLQYPVYCLHTNIEDLTPDPLDNLDRLIASFIYSKCKLSEEQLASLLGCSKKTVQLRMEALIKDELIKEGRDGLNLTPTGIDVFNKKMNTRIHKRAYDFILDGINFNPLPNMFYGKYRSKLINENEISYITDDKGYTRIIKPFQPDLVHSPPDKDLIVDKLFSFSEKERDTYGIPAGLSKVEIISFTRLSYPVMVAASTVNDVVHKEVIDGFTRYSLNEELSYLELVRDRALCFRGNLSDKIKNLEFKLRIKPAFNEKDKELIEPYSNWFEIDNYANCENKLFFFTNEDLIKLVHLNYGASQFNPDSLMNSETEVGLNITRDFLLGSNDRHKLIASLKRKRDYIFGYRNNHVFRIFYHITSSDKFVDEVMEFNEQIDKIGINELSEGKIMEINSNYRQLLYAGGRFEILEKLDIVRHMKQFN